MRGREAQRGNVFFALFAAVAMVGVVGASTMTIMNGPVRSMQQVTKRTIAENNMIAAGKLTIMVASQPGGDCDSDNMVEPPPFEAPGSNSAPMNGGILPDAVGAAKQDPWGNDYGYCVWDHGTTIKDGTCPGDAGRLTGAAGATGAVVAIISSGPDRIFQTGCQNEGAGEYVLKTPGSDDVVMVYTYDEAQAIAGGTGLWAADGAEGATIQRDLEVTADDGSGPVFAVDNQAANPSLKVDFIQQLTQGSVEFLSNIKLGSNWLSGDGDDEGISIDGSGNVLMKTGGQDGFWFQSIDDAATDNSYDIARTTINTTGAAYPELYLRTIETTSEAASILSGGDLFISAAGNRDISLGRVESYQPGSPSSPSQTSRLFIDNSTGNVGIGTTNPPSRLTIEQIDPADGNGGNDIRISTVMDSGTNSLLGFTAGGTLAAPTPVTAGRILMDVGGRGYDGTDYQNAADIRFIAENDFATSTDGAITFRTLDGGVFTEKMRLTSAGNVGIGTSSPERILHVVGEGDVDDDLYIESNNDINSNAGIIAFVRSRGTNTSKQPPLANDFLGGLYGRGWYDGGYYGGAGIDIRTTSNWASELSAYMGFSTVHDGSYTQRMRINPDGNVGIGNNSPKQKLHIDGTPTGSDRTMVQVGEGSRSLFLTHSDPIISANARYDDGTWRYEGSGEATAISLSSASNGEIRFYAAPLGSAGQAFSFAEKMRISNDDYVRLGNVTSDSTKSQYGTQLYFSGARAFSPRDSDNSDPIWMARYNVAQDETELRVNVSDNITGNDALVIGSTYTSGWTPAVRLDTAGNIKIEGNGYKPGGGDWAATSDARLKDVQGAYEKGLADITALSPVRYRYKQDNARGEPSDQEFVGLLAQEVQPHFPETVEKADDGFFNFDPSELTYAFINAFKEVRARLASLTDADRDQNNQITALQMRIDALESELSRQCAAR